MLGSKRRVSMAWACVAMAALGALGACKTAPTDAKPPAAGIPAPAPAPSPPAPPAPPVPPPVSPLPADEIRAAIVSVRNQLDQGQEDSALELVRRILATDSNHKQAASYLKQIKDDPVALYGTDSSPYRVVAGDTLASIAQRYMKDSDQFYGLARYNEIRVPRQLQAGQTIKVPGKGSVPAGGTVATSPPVPAAPPPPSPSAPPPSPTAPPPAPQAATAPPAPVPAPPAPAPAPVVDVKRQIDQCTREARRAREKQDLCTAIDRWTCVLQLDPSNRNAQAERDRAVDLNKKLPNPPC